MMRPFELLLLVNLAATLYMVGLIWVVQIVHYPLFELVGATHFESYQRRHQNSISMIVAAPMLVEAASSIGLLLFASNEFDWWLAIVGVVLVTIVWISTAGFQVPCHSRLTSGFDRQVHRRLVSSNWIRTVAWTARGGVVLWLLVNLISRGT